MLSPLAAFVSRLATRFPTDTSGEQSAYHAEELAKHLLEPQYSNGSISPLEDSAYEFPDALRQYSQEEVFQLNHILGMIALHNLADGNLYYMGRVISERSQEESAKMIRFLYQHSDHIGTIKNVSVILYIAYAFPMLTDVHFRAAVISRDYLDCLYHALPAPLLRFIGEHPDHTEAILDLYAKGRSGDAIRSIIGSTNVSPIPLLDGEL